HPIFPRHVVGGRKERAAGRPPEHPPVPAPRDEEGLVRVPGPVTFYRRAPRTGEPPIEEALQGILIDQRTVAVLRGRSLDRPAHPLVASRRPRIPSSSAASIAVHAMATAPSNTARSAASLMQCAVNSGWWLTAG